MPYTCPRDLTQRSPKAEGAVVRSLDAEVPLARVRTLDDIVSSSIRPQRFSATLIVLFSVAALLLAAIGVYGVVTVAAVLTAVALAASAIPALRATRVDPVVALRGD